MPPKVVKPVQRPGAKKKPPIHKLPDPIREGEVVKDNSKKSWKLGKSIGVGGFGEIYAGLFSFLYCVLFCFGVLSSSI